MNDDKYRIEIMPPKTLLSDSPAARMEQLLELWAPMQYDECGCPLGRDESAGVITKAQFLELLDTPAPKSPED